MDKIIQHRFSRKGGCIELFKVIFKGEGKSFRLVHLRLLNKVGYVLRPILRAHLNCPEDYPIVGSYTIIRPPKAVYLVAQWRNKIICP